MKKILVTEKKGKIKNYLLVDNEDYKFLKQWNWLVFRKKNNKIHYVGRNIIVKTINKKIVLKRIFIHRVIINNCPKGKVIDHINQNPLDNRKCNLRICTNSENLMNRHKQINNISGFKGVSFDKSKKYRAQIKFNKKVYYLGVFKSKIKAALAYDQAALKYHGEFACLNFPKKSRKIYEQSL